MPMEIFWPLLYEAFIIGFESIFANNWLNRISPLWREIPLNANRKLFSLHLTTNNVINLRFLRKYCK
jgi:hypothetical protein